MKRTYTQKFFVFLLAACMILSIIPYSAGASLSQEREANEPRFNQNYQNYIFMQGSGKLLSLRITGGTSLNAYSYSSYQGTSELPLLRWTFTSDGSGNYYIRSVNDDTKALTVNTSTLSVTAATFVSGSNTQKWQLTPSTNGNYLLKSVATSKYLKATVSGSGARCTVSSTGTVLGIYTATEYVPPTSIIATPSTVHVAVGGFGNVTLSAPQASPPLTNEWLTWSSLYPGLFSVSVTGTISGIAPGTGTMMVTDTRSGKAAMVTVVVHALPVGCFAIVNEDSGMCLTVGGSPASGVQVVQRPYTGDVKQKWHIYLYDDGYYRIQTAAMQSVFDSLLLTANGDYENAANALQLYAFGGSGETARAHWIGDYLSNDTYKISTAQPSHRSMTILPGQMNVSDAAVVISSYSASTPGFEWSLIEVTPPDYE